MLTVHHLRVSQSERIVWLCEELGLAYELKCYDRDPQTRAAPPEYKALHPLGAAPVITDGDMVLAETNAIIDYIIARHGGGRLSVAPDAANYPDYLYWLHYVNGTLQPSGSLPMMLNRAGVPEDGPFMQAMVQRRKRAVQAVENRLSRSPYLAGAEFTAADIVMGFSLTTVRYFSPLDLSAFPTILAYLVRISARPAYRAAMQKGDPDMALLLS
ncbi:glutathione S-transferase family protein [Acidocella sp.]|uniref:glutathione S-transferase family protein n=1 Tax=Acidocella sp. TaxID=50710 RepID=UPI0026269794|nr:glutathione S-transferase [Acidocella sp.]